MTNSKLLNISLVLFLFVLFSGMSFAANYNITECGSFSFPGLYELTHDIEKGSIDVFFGNSSETLLCSSLYFDWISCVNSNPSNPDLCNSNKENYEICLKSESLEEHRTACLNFRAMGGLDSDTNIVLDCKGHKIITDEVDFGILVYEPHAVLKYGGEESSWSSVVQNVEIRNCHIENSKTGAIALIDVRNINVINNTLVNNVPSENFLATDLMDCSGGIILMNSYYSNISYNNLTNNTFGICIAHSKDRKYLYSIVSTKNSIHNNVAYNNRFTGLGIAGSSHDNDIYENIFNENTYGVIVGAAYNNTFRNLTIMNNKYVDFAGDPVIYSEFLCQNYIDGANHLIPGSGSIQVTDGKLYFYNEPVHLLDDGINPTLPTSEVLICANDSNLTHFVLRGNPSVRNNGIFVLGNNLRVSGLTASDVMAGVYVNAGDNVVIQNSTFVDVKNGIMLNSVTNADISKNTFDDYRATGIVGFTSPLVIYELMTGLPPTSSQLSNISIYDNIFYGSDEVISVKDAYRGAFSLPGVKPIYLGDLLDLGTGSATSLLFAQNVNYYNNEIKKSQTYGFAGVFLFNSEIYDNIIENIQGISAYEITPGGFFESMDLDEMITMLPGTGVLLDSAFTNVSSNDILNSINGFVSLPFTSLFSLYISGPNYVYENKIIDNAFLGFGLLSPFNILHSNLVYGNNYTFAIMTEGNYVFNNFFNNTNEIYHITNSHNEFNLTLTSLPSGMMNIIGGQKLGGNFWGNHDGLGYSQYCLDENDDGICDVRFDLNSDNTDHHPLALSSGVVPPNCIDLDQVREIGEIKEEWGHVVYDKNSGTFYINDDTLLCKKEYYNNFNGNYIQMNGSYSLDCADSIFYNDVSSVKYAIGIYNEYNDVTIKKCNFVRFNEGVVSSPRSEYDGSSTTLLWNKIISDKIGVSLLTDNFLKMNLERGTKYYNNKIYSLTWSGLNIYNSINYDSLFSDYVPAFIADYDYIPLKNNEILFYGKGGIYKYEFDSKNLDELWNVTFKDGIYTKALVHPNGNLYVSLVKDIGFINGDTGGHYIKEVYLSSYNMTDGSEIFSELIYDEEKEVETIISLDKNNNILVTLLYSEDVEINTYDSVTGKLISISISPSSYVTDMFVDENNNIYEYLIEKDPSGLSNHLTLTKYKHSPVFNFFVSPEGDILNGIVSGDGNVIAYIFTDVTGTTYKIIVSKDGGETWETPVTLEADYILDISYDGEIIITWNKGLGEYYISKDTGVTFDKLKVEMFQYLDDVHKYVYGRNKSVNQGVYRYSIDDETFEFINLPTSSPNLRGFFSNDIIILIDDSKKYSVSKDYGNNWSELKDISIFDNLDYLEGKISREDGIILIHSYDNKKSSGESKFFISKNEGDTFEEISPYVSGREGYILDFSLSDNGQHIYVVIKADDGEYISKSTDCGVTWSYALNSIRYNKGLFVSSNGLYNYYLHNDNSSGKTYWNLFFEVNDTTEYIEDIADEVDSFSNDGCKLLSVNKGSITMLNVCEFLNREVTTKTYEITTFRQQPYILLNSDYLYLFYNNKGLFYDYINYKVFDSNLSVYWEDSISFNQLPTTVSSLYVNDKTKKVEILGRFNRIDNFRASFDLENKKVNLIEPSNYESLSEIVPIISHVKMDSEENIIALGSNRYPEFSSIKLVKYDKNGSVLFDNLFTLNTISNVAPSDLLIDSEGNYIISGVTEGNNIFIMKVSKEGEKINEHVYSTNDLEKTPVLMEGGDNYVLINRKRDGIENIIFDKGLKIEEIQTQNIIQVEIAFNKTHECVHYYNPDGGNNKLLLVDYTVPNPAEGIIYNYDTDIMYNNVEIGTNGECYLYNDGGNNVKIYSQDASFNDTSVDITGSLHKIKAYDDGKIYLIKEILIKEMDMSNIRLEKLNLKNGTLEGVSLPGERMTQFTDIFYKDGKLLFSGFMGESKATSLSEEKNIIYNYNGFSQNWIKTIKLDSGEGEDVFDTISEIVDMGNLGNDKYFGLETIKKIEIDGSLIGTDIALYEFDSRGNYKKIFKISDTTTPFATPLKTIYKDSNYYVLVGELASDESDEGIYPTSKYVVYSYGNKGNFRWKKELDLYGFNLFFLNGYMVIDGNQLIVGGTKLGDDVIEGLGLPFSNEIYVNFISTSNGAVTEKNITQTDDLINMVKGVEVVNEGGQKRLLLFTSGAYINEVIGDIGFSATIYKTDMNGNILEGYPKNSKDIFFDEIEVCQGGWNKSNKNDIHVKTVSSRDGSTLISTLGLQNDESLLYKSIDDGETWTNITSEPRQWREIHVSDNGNVIAGINHNIHYSTDGGDTWMELGITSESISLDGTGEYIFSLSENKVSKCSFVVNCSEIITGLDYSYGKIKISGDGSTVLILYYLSNNNNNVKIFHTDGSGYHQKLNHYFNKIDEDAFSLSYDGSKILFVYEDSLFLYTNYDFNSNRLDTFGNVGRAVISSDGNTIMIQDDDNKNIFISEDDGKTWKMVNAGSDIENVQKLELSSDGSKRYVFGGYNYDKNKNYPSYIYTDPGSETCIPKNLSKDILLVNLAKLSDDVYASTNMGDSTIFFDSKGNFVDIFDKFGFGKVHVIDNELHVFIPDLENRNRMKFASLYREKLLNMGFGDTSVIHSGGVKLSDTSTVSDFQPTSYGILVGGSYENVSALFGMNLEKIFDVSLNNIIIEDIGIFNDKNSIIVDTSGSNAKNKKLKIGCADFRGVGISNSRCLIEFLEEVDDNNGVGMLIRNGNTMLEREFVAMDMDDLATNIFNLRARISLTAPSTAKNIKVYKSSNFYKTKKEIIDNGEVYEENPIVKSAGGEVVVTFEVDGWSSYAISYDSGSPPPPPKYKDISLTYDYEMCLDKEYEIKLTDLYDSTIPVKNARVVLYDYLYDTYEIKSNEEGIISFTPTKLGLHRIKVDSVGDYRAIQLHENKYFIVKNCSSPKPILNCKEPGLNYELTLDDFPTCKYECTILSCGENEELIDEPSKLRCYCKYVEPEEPGEEDRKSLMGIRFGKEEFCEHEFFNLEMFSPDDNCIGDVSIIIPKIDFEGKTSNKGTLTLNFEEEGSYVISASKKGCLTTSEIIKIIDCSEDLYEPVIDKPLHEQLFNAINDFFRTSIKSGCEGFYFDGIPSIFCDLVWVVVILGSIAGAYLEPDRNKKVLILVTPSIIAVVFLPIAGALGAGVGVYLGYTSKKRLEEELLVEAEQMEEEIMK